MIENYLINDFNISTKVQTAAKEALTRCKSKFEEIENITKQNQRHLLKAFIDNKVSESCFNMSTGYGYGDKGRDVLDKVCASAFFAEDAIIRHSFASGTHTISTALFAILRPGDTMLCISGTPYDTLLTVIDDNNKGKGSLADFGIKYKQIELTEKSDFNYSKISDTLKSKEKIKLVYIQRSRGYSSRKSLSLSKISKICNLVRELSPDSIIMVDNCYGEFTELREPPAIGADLIAGSLIKNAGGAIAPSGGYIAGKKQLIELCAYRTTTVSTGREIGASLGFNRQIYMGLFNAPHITGEALKTAAFAAALFSNLGFDVDPGVEESRSDIVQTIQLKSREQLIAFCQGIQSGSPVDSFVKPLPWSMPGYDCDVIMAAGTFTLGSSIELSADAPLREPYTVYVQGGWNFHSAEIALLLAADAVLNI